MIQEYLGLLRAKLNLLNKIVIDIIWGFVRFSLGCVWLFCDPIDYSPPGSSVYGIFQARKLEFLSPEDLSELGTEPESPALAGGVITTEPPGKTQDLLRKRGHCYKKMRKCLGSRKPIPIVLASFWGTHVTCQEWQKGRFPFQNYCVGQKIHLDFCIRWYRKTWVNLLDSPVIQANPLRMESPRSH